MQKCTICKEVKTLDEFHKNKNKKNGRSPYCKLCAISKSKKWNLDNPERVKVNSTKHRFTRHNITQEQYKKLLDGQFGVCKICNEAPKTDTEFHIDHDHKCCPGVFSCGKCIRGILCGRCNVVIGQIKEDRLIALSMWNYLKI